MVVVTGLIFLTSFLYAKMDNGESGPRLTCVMLAVYRLNAGMQGGER